MTTGILRRFATDDRGNIAVMTAVLALPLLSAVGLAVDYSSAVSYRSNMQNALDAATISIMSLPKETTLAERKVKLQQFYLANGGTGTADLPDFKINNLGSSDSKTNATSSMKTSVMSLVGYSKVDVAVNAAAHKEPALVEANFEILSASGWYSKTMSVYGVKLGETRPTKLLQIEYIYNKGEDPKGYGTMKTSTVKLDSRGREVLTQVQAQECTTKNVSNFNNLPAGAITGTFNGQRKLTTCKMTQNGNAKIDVSQMESLYLQMDMVKKNSTFPQNPDKAVVLRTDNPATSNHLYVGPAGVAKDDLVEMPAGKLVDIFTVVPCNEKSTQAWEDGGNDLPAPGSNADFFYNVTGKCDFSQRPFGISLTK